MPVGDRGELLFLLSVRVCEKGYIGLASKLKQLWWLMLLFAICNVVMAVMLYQGGTKEEEPAVSYIPAKEVYSIGILQAANLPEKDKMTQGVLESLKAGGYVDGKNCKIEVIKANGNEKKLENGAKKLIRGKKDLIITIGSQATKQVSSLTKSIPVVGVGVLYFQKDEELLQCKNLTGITDYPLVVNQIRTASRFMKLDPLGIIYNPKEESSVQQLQFLRAVAEQKHIHLYEVAYDENKLPEAQFKKLVGQVSAVYVPEDTTILTHFDTLVKVMNESKIPIIGEQSEMVQQGAVISVSPSYYRLGFSGGRIACRLLKGDVLPSDIPVTRQNDPNLVVNMKQLNEMNLPLPGDLWQRARKLYLYDGQPARP